MAPDENEAGLCCIPHSTLHLRACRNTGGNEFFKCLNLVPALWFPLSHLETKFFATYLSRETFEGNQQLLTSRPQLAVICSRLNGRGLVNRSVIIHLSSRYQSQPQTVLP